MWRSSCSAGAEYWQLVSVALAVIGVIVAKKAFALRLDEAMLSALQRWADDEFRSINGQIEYLLHDALKKNGRLPRTHPSVAADKEQPEN